MSTSFQLLVDRTIKFGWSVHEIHEFKHEKVQKPIIKCAQCQKYGLRNENCPFNQKCNPIFPINAQIKERKDDGNVQTVE